MDIIYNEAKQVTKGVFVHLPETKEGNRVAFEAEYVTSLSEIYKKRDGLYYLDIKVDSNTSKLRVALVNIRNDVIDYILDEKAVDGVSREKIINRYHANTFFKGNSLVLEVHPDCQFLKDNGKALYPDKPSKVKSSQLLTITLAFISLSLNNKIFGTRFAVTKIKRHFASERTHLDHEAPDPVDALEYDNAKYKERYSKNFKGLGYKK